MIENISILKAKIISVSPLFIGDDQQNPLIDDEGQMAYLPATSIAGAFRAYLKNAGKGYKKLFGAQEENCSIMSSIYIKDSFAEISNFDRRDGIKIDNEFGNNVEGQKIERTFIGQGLEFELGFEIHSKNEDEEELKEMLYSCLMALDEGIIRFGGNKSNGLGIFELVEAKEVSFNLVNNPDNLIKYLNNDYSNCIDVKKNIDNITLCDNYVEFNMEGKLTTPLMIKAPKTFDSKDVDDRSFKLGDEYLIPGSSFKGVLRSRVEKIGNFFDSLKEAKAIFGSIGAEKNKARQREEDNILSRVFVKESVIDNRGFEEKIYNRTKIDRFTGGVRTGALMNDIPVKGETQFNVIYRKKGEKSFDNYAIGILALALRDLGTENLSLGGNNNIGRGRFKADTMYVDDGGSIINIDFNTKTISNEDRLNSYVKAVKAFKCEGGGNEQ